MKKLLPGFVFFLLAGGLAWYVWFKPVKRETEEAKPPTDVPVHVGKIVRRTLRGFVTAYGSVEAEPPGDRPAASARIGTFVPGVITAVKCAEGQRVEQGAVLFQLDSRAADVAVERARRVAEFAAKTLERQRSLLAVEGTSRKLWLDAAQAFTAASNDLAAAQTQQALQRVTASLSGTVTRVNVKPGEAVDLTTVLAEVVDLERLVVTASLPSRELGALKSGQPAEVLADPPDAPLAGTLTFISPQIDGRTGTAPVRVSLPPKSGLRPGQLVTVRIVSQEHQDRLAVPVESVVRDVEEGNVISVVEKDQAVRKAVQVGLRDGGWMEVEAEGLQAGMTVVTEGAYGLPKRTKVHRLGQEPAGPATGQAGDTEKTEPE